MTFYRRAGKRAFDLSLTIPALLVLLPVLGFVAFLVRTTLGKPVLFRQPRPGKNADTFVLLKFRTMTDRTGPDGVLLPDGERLTGVGAFLRSTSLDELPSLLNVLRGEMSLVGPRPLLRRYVARYSREQSRRHEVLPGVTGWAQVNGRNSISWEEKLSSDVWYVDHCCLALDLKILGRTIARVIERRGIASEGHATMPEFMGTNRTQAS